MAENTKIEWCHATFNPWRGCTKISDGCKNCYAESLSKRNPKVLGIWGKDGTRVLARDQYWKEPIEWNKEAQESGERKRVFCASLADIFEDHPAIQAEWRARLGQLIESTPWLDWLLLTKRPENILKMIPSFWPDKLKFRLPDNVWIGTSVEDQEQAQKRIPLLHDIPARIRFLSCEPLLEYIDLGFSPAYIDWVIIGGESGHNARECHTDNIRSLAYQCSTLNTPVFIKQLGSNSVAAGSDQKYLIKMVDKKGGDINEFPPDLRIRQFPEVQK